MKTRFRTDPKMIWIRRELAALYGKEEAKRTVSLAKRHYEEAEMLCRFASKGEKKHLHNTILPTVSFYKALLEIDNEHALEYTNAILLKLCRVGGSLMNGLLKLPGMKSIFLWLLPKMAVKNFGRDCGFDYESFHADKNGLQMDMTACPYCRFAELLGCSELIPTFCESDFATYGNLRGVRFTRSQTLGTGGTKCDFRFRKKSK